MMTATPESYAGRTDIGCVRARNEDRFGLFPVLGLFALADGIGGITYGGVAAQIAIDSIQEFFAAYETDGAIENLDIQDASKHRSKRSVQAAFELANERVHECQNDPLYVGTGATLALLKFYEEGLCIAHVGDSRVYKFLPASDELICLTREHSLLNDYLARGLLKDDEIEGFAFPDVIVQALGFVSSVEPELIFEPTTPGIIYILCSDGLYKMISDTQIRRTVSRHQDNLERCCSALIDLANEAGGNDNITVVTVKV